MQRPIGIVTIIFVFCAFFIPLHAEEQYRFRFPREPGITSGGYPLPLCGKPLTKSPIISTESNAQESHYAPVYIPGKEELGPDEMRIVCIGSGNPPIRIGQAATGWVVELGNGEKFAFDIGGGCVGNLWSIGSSPAVFDKLFITHLHIDHMGAILPMFDAMGWSRNVPMHVWGPSGHEPRFGTSTFVEHIQKASAWHIESKIGIAPSDGMKLVAHEFDYAKFTPTSPRLKIYDSNGVVIYAFPVLHTIYGSVGYRLEWNGLSMAFTGDSQPSTLEAEEAKGVDVFIHEAFISPEIFATKNNMPLAIAKNVVEKAHTTPEQFGWVMNISKPRLAVATHYFLDDDLIDPFFKDVDKSYNGPVVLSQDMMVINVSKNRIVTRMAVPNLLSWAEPAPKTEIEPTMDPMSQGQRPKWMTERIIITPQ